MIPVLSGASVVLGFVSFAFVCALACRRVMAATPSGGGCENLGYRQLLTLWRVIALVDVARGRKDWGEMRRRGLGYEPARSSSRGR